MLAYTIGRHCPQGRDRAQDKMASVCQIYKRERERESKKERKKERKKEFKNMSCERGGAIPFVAFSHAKSQRLTYRQLDVRYPAQFLQSHDHFWERRAKK